MSKRRIIKLLPPRKGLRRYWKVQLRPVPGQRVVRCTGARLEAAARQYGELLVRQDYPALAAILDLKTMRRPGL